ncbi:MAG: hypothetical protein AAFY50_06345 [Cyanobacteria bacterium J06648_1]
MQQKKLNKIVGVEIAAKLLRIATHKIEKSQQLICIAPNNSKDFTLI